MKELIRSAFLGFMFGMLYFSGMPLEFLLIFGVIMLIFISFKKKITLLINDFYNKSPHFLSKIPISLRPILTFIIILIIFMILKQIIYFCLSYFFGININIEEYLNTTEV